MIETLGKILGNPARVKIMRFFMLNREQGFEAIDISSRSKIGKDSVKKELALLAAAGFVKKKIFFKEIKDSTKGGAGKVKRKKVQGFFLNQDFPRLEVWSVLIVGSDLIKKEDLLSRFKGVGKIKFLAVSGVFIQNMESRVDIVIVGDNLKRSAAEQVIKGLESEIGKELVYAIFETPEFKYRFDVYDKLVYDILDYPHEIIIDLVGVKNLLKK